ncbi:MAG: NAD(P)/FAD-dependent oxidoreductase [Candidatus Rokubacteria bacterium]|nr:NAD(P)/FAD-dependent oxidoreductase [Candidatus Rokubacteria bacterium]
MLVSTVELAWRARRAAGLGVTGTAGLGLDWGAVIARKNRLVAEWSAGKDTGFERQGIAVLRGRATFRGPHELDVAGRRVTAERVVIATGSSPARPPIPGIEHAVTSDELLDLTTLPSRMVVVGGGYVGMELGFAFARAGTRVTVLQSGPHVLPAVDDEIREALLGIGRDAGLEVRTGARVTRMGADRTVEAEVGGRAERFPAEIVLVATGRPPNTAGLGLEAAGVTVERGGVKVNEFRQSTTAPYVYAAGDVTGQHQHTPAAWYEGRLVAENAPQGNQRAVDFRWFPTAVFTIPAIGQIGLTEAEARRQGLEVSVSRVPFEDSTAAAVREETEGLVKVVAEASTGRLLGVHILGPGAEDLIHVAAAAMRGGLTRHDLAAMHYVFPTLAGSIFDAMYD